MSASNCDGHSHCSRDLRHQCRLLGHQKRNLPGYRIALSKERTKGGATVNSKANASMVGGETYRSIIHVAVGVGACQRFRQVVLHLQGAVSMFLIYD